MANIKNHVLVNGIKIGKATVVSNSLLKKGSCIPGTTIIPTSVTFHQTDCIDVDAPRMHLALTNANNDKYAGTSKSNYRLASWHITVGHDKIIQNCPFNWKAYAQGCTSGNNTSISIEMCMYNDKEKTYQTYLNAIELYKLLIKEYKSSLVAKAHYDWTKKNCPSWLRASKFGYSWSWFKGELTKKTTTSNVDTNVKNLQIVLNKSYGLKLDVDGSFGPKTKEAVKKYYLKNLTKNEHAKWLQQALNTLGYDITVDGSYGPATEKVVKEFQNKNDLSVDGYAGLNTHTKIINSL